MTLLTLKRRISATLVVGRLKSWHVLAAMLLCQVAWLLFLYYTGSTIFSQSILWLMGYALLAGFFTLCLPIKVLYSIRQKKIALLRKPLLPILVLTMLVAVQGFAIAWLAPPYPDERNMLKAAKIVATEGIDAFFEQYAQLPWLGNQHPPLAPLIFGAVVQLVHNSLFSIRVASLVFGIGSVLTTYLLAKNLYGPATGLLSALLLLSFPRFLRLNLQANNDSHITFLFLVSLLLLWYLYRQPRMQWALLAGVVIGVGLLTKYTIALLYPIIVMFVAATRSFKTHKRYVLVILLVSGAMLLAWLLYAVQIGVFAAQAEKITALAGAGNNPGGEFRLLSGYRTAMRIDYLFVKIPLGLGMYSLPLILLGATWLGTHYRASANIFLLVWLVGVIAPVSILLPDIRYLLPAFPALAIMAVAALHHRRIAPEPIILLSWLFFAGRVMTWIG